MATLDEIRLQQLLSPFQNQNIGITNTTAASPFINTADILNQYNVPGLRNQNLVDAIIAQNMKKNVGNFINAPQDYYPSDLGFINAPQDYYPGGITKLAPLQNLGIDTSYGVANEPDVEQVEYLGDKPKGGIADLLRTLVGFAVPGASFLMNKGRGALQGIQSLNQRLRSTDFGRSKTLQEYFQKRRERKQAERAQQAMPDVYRDARERGFTNDRGGFSTDRADDAGTSLGSGQFSPSTSRGRSGY